MVENKCYVILTKKENEIRVPFEISSQKGCSYLNHISILLAHSYLLNKEIHRDSNSFECSESSF